MGKTAKLLRKSDLELRALFSYLLRGERQHEEAIQVLKQGLVIDPEARDIYNALGLIYLDINMYDEAIAAHQRYVELAPDEPNAHDSLGMSYQCAGRYHEAIMEYQRALALNPRFGIAVFHLGNTYIQMGRYGAALEQYHRGLQIAPGERERAVGYGAIAQVHLRKGDFDQAAAAAKVELKHDKYHVWNSLVIALRRDDTATAEKLKEQLFEQTPYIHRGQRLPERRNYYRRGYLALKSGQEREAIEYFKEALRHSPLIWEQDSLEDCLAHAYLELGRLDEAIAEYERILRFNRNYPLAHYHLAQALEQKGQTAQARAHYERFLQIWSDADRDIPQVIEAKKQLAGQS